MKNEIDLQLWNFSQIEQTHTSSITSVNAAQMPKTIKFIDHQISPNQVWADIGGGRFDNVKDYFSNKGATLWIYDPFNRSHEENSKAVEHIANGKCDGVMVNNVLNVVENPATRQQIIKQAFNSLKDNACAYFKIYEGNKTGEKTYVEKKEASSVQLNQKTDFYLFEIKAVFGELIHKKGELIYATKSPALKNELKELITQATKIGVPNRSKKYGVGKQMGDDFYIHKDYTHILPQDYQDYLKTLNENVTNFDFQIIKYNAKKNQYSFIQSPDFDTSNEPIVGNIVVIDGEKNLRFIKQKKDPQIYHHKWNFVADDYPGFSVTDSVQRSIDWKSKVGNNKEISSRIGTKSFWDNLLIQLNVKSSTPKIP